MRLHELAHRLTTDVVLCIPQEHRRTFLSYLVSGFDSEGKQIAHSVGQINTLVCLDCPRSSENCDDCHEIQQAEKE
jgi:hypothetical protein